MKKKDKKANKEHLMKSGFFRASTMKEQGAERRIHLESGAKRIEKKQRRKYNVVETSQLEAAKDDGYRAETYGRENAA